MQRFLQRVGMTMLFAVMTSATLLAQEQPDTTKPTSLDPKMIDWQNARIAKEYTIASVTITGVNYLDTSQVVK